MFQIGDHVVLKDTNTPQEYRCVGYTGTIQYTGRDFYGNDFCVEFDKPNTDGRDWLWVRQDEMELIGRPIEITDQWFDSLVSLYGEN